MWFCASIAAICALRRGRPAAAGAGLALAAALRVFPVLFLAGFAMRHARRLAAGAGLDAGARRLAAGAAATGAVLLLAGTLAAGRGPGVWLESAANLREHVELVARNAFGLEYALRMHAKWVALREADPAVMAMASEERQEALFAPLRPLYWGVAAGFLALLWRAATRPGAEDWEAVAAGFALIPVLTRPACYYTGFVVAAALLATRRPRIGRALLLTLAAWCGAVATWGQEPEAFVWASWIGLAFFAYALVEMGRPAPAAPPAPPRAA
jgi:hypothetical protein